MGRRQSVLGRGAADFYTLCWYRISLRDCLVDISKSEQNEASKVWIGVQQPKS